MNVVLIRLDHYVCSSPFLVSIERYRNVIGACSFIQTFRYQRLDLVAILGAALVDDGRKVAFSCDDRGTT
ncbi:MAG TPA: hypothetical protein DCM54_12060 [Gammaproteobacteria bacterium]|nr:hypothetical protein [Gammaproteobacteria bacterium]